MSTPLSRRRLLTGATAVALAPVVAACGPWDGATSTATSADSSADAEKGAFPVTIEHKLGSTTLTAAPKRVVCVGLVEQDALLALGVVPVGVTKWFGDAPGQVFPWATDALGDAELPTVLTDADGIQLEKIAGLRPDLVIGQYAGLKKRDYESLSKIAPTVAQPKGYVDYGVPWQESTRVVGQAVGRPARAERLVRRIDERLAAERAAHPEFAGATAAVATIYEGIFVYGPQDPRTRLLGDLGFEFPERLDDVGGDEFGASISPEQIRRLDGDVTVWLSSESQTSKGTGGLSNKGAPAEEGRQVFISEKDGAFFVGHSMLTPLSIPYVLDRYVPQLAAAVDGDPRTAVPDVR